MTEAGGASLVTGSENIEPLIDGQPQKIEDKFSLKAKAVFAFLVLLSVTIMVVSFANEKPLEDYDVMPVKLRMLLPPEEPFLLRVGESRVLDVVFYSGHDDRTIDDYKSVNKRETEWEVSPSGVVEVDIYGTLSTLKAGEAKVTVRSLHDSTIFDSQTIRVVDEYPAPLPQQKRIVHSEVKAKLNQVLQRRVTFFTKIQALNVQDLPQTIKNYILNPTQAEPKTEVNQENTKWTITQYADGSKRSFLTRVNSDEHNDRDKTMYFIGNRYLPGEGFYVFCIEDDKAKGVWTANTKGEVSHIEMISLSYKEKAYQMSKNTEEFVMRHGLASDSSFNGKNWVPAISDNDGLWTSMYAVGELMRYASLKRLPTSTVQEIAAAQKSALKPLKAVLLIANVPCRDKTIDARIRHFKNTRLDHLGSFLSKQFLIQNRTASTDSYPGSPADGVGLFGIEAGSNIGEVYLGGKKRYTDLPINKSDWTKDSTTHTPATTKRKLKGFWARTFVIEALDGPPPSNDGLFFKHNSNKTQTVLSRADLLYDYNATEHPVLDLGSSELPQVFKHFLNINKAQYYKQDLIYKGDTSVDEVIGHLFVYKVAYDILQESDPQEKAVKDLIRETVVSFCTLLTNNGYNHIDATGQGTKWGKLVRQFLLSDFTLQDGPLDALELMLCFKLCYYMTGEQRWKRQYQFLIHDESFRYLDLVALFWKRWRYRAFNQDASPSSNFYHMKEDVKYDEEEVIRHIFHSLNFSDDEQAFLAFYLAFQLEDDPEYLKKYKEGIDSFWVLISRSENPLWYFMYQLTNPKAVNKDYYGNNILEVASWHLSRTNIETRTTAAFVEGSRKDVLVEGKEELCQCSVNPQQIIGHRKHKTDAFAVKRAINSKIDANYDPMNIYNYKPLPSDQRSIHKFNGGTLENIYSSNPNGMEAATVYTLPYWFGVYHKMIEISENSQQ